MKSAGLSNVSKDTRFWKTLGWLVSFASPVPSAEG